MKHCLVFPLLIVIPISAQSIKIYEGCIGVIREAQNAANMHGTAFFAGRQGRVITAAHVVPQGRYTYEGIGTTLKPQERVVGLKLAYQLPEYDLAVFNTEPLCQGCVTCKQPFALGDLKRVRPGDNLFYLGWSPGQGTVQANIAQIQAIGSVLNGSTTVDFIEFNGVGVPGYSGGPVIGPDNTVVAVMREAWAKQGINGGPSLLMNRAVSVEPVVIIEQRTEGLYDEKR